MLFLQSLSDVLHYLNNVGSKYTSSKCESNQRCPQIQAPRLNVPRLQGYSRSVWLSISITNDNLIIWNSNPNIDGFLLVGNNPHSVFPSHIRITKLGTIQLCSVPQTQKKGLFIGEYCLTLAETHE